MQSRGLVGFVLWLPALVACGARSPLEDERRDAGAGATDADGGQASGGSPSNGGSQSNGGSPSGNGGSPAEPQCLCPELPGYAPCVLPLMCCPVVAACEDPETFNCTGSVALHCDEPQPG